MEEELKNYNNLNMPQQLHLIFSLQFNLDIIDLEQIMLLI